MHPEIAKRFDGIEARRKALVERVKALPADKQNKKPGNKSFSPADVVKHMALAEEGNVARMRKNPPSTIKSRKVKHGPFFANTIAKMQNPVKELPTLGYMVPKGETNVTDADKEWENLRKETAGYLEQVEGPDSPLAKFNFFFGTLSASDYLALLEAHHHYHEVRFPQV